MEVSDKLYAPATVQAKEPPVPIGYEVGWATDVFWTR
jgi:hypothetical protein